jgi:hypothetical protein
MPVRELMTANPKSCISELKAVDAMQVGGSGLGLVGGETVRVSGQHAMQHEFVAIIVLLKLFVTWRVGGRVEEVHMRTALLIVAVFQEF